jgi:hypothetical protein
MERGVTITGAGAVSIVACVEDSQVIDKILTHLVRKRPNRQLPICRLPERHAPPGLFDWPDQLTED